jgi:hypothetical protein
MCVFVTGATGFIGSAIVGERLSLVTLSPVSCVRTELPRPLPRHLFNKIDNGNLSGDITIMALAAPASTSGRPPFKVRTSIQRGPLHVAQNQKKGETGGRRGIAKFNVITPYPNLTAAPPRSVSRQVSTTSR